MSQFAGSWSGTWANTEDGVHGTFDWTISDAGRIDGRAYSITNDLSGAMAGHVGADGKLNMIGYVPDDEPSNQHNGFAFQGTAVIDGDGRFVASVILNASPFAHTLVVVLERN